MTQTLTITRPDDWHLHLRDGAMLAGIARESARDFARAIIMPNLVPPVLTGADAAAYRDRIYKVLPQGSDFKPLMTLYLTEETDPAEIVSAHRDGIIAAVKLYPAGATTNSASGVRDFDKVRAALDAMAQAGIPLLTHGEVTDPEVDIFDREAVFIDRILDPIRRATPGLKVVMEHITTADAVAYVAASDTGLGATITTHHLVINRNHILAGGIRPHYYCLPVAKRETHRQALLKAATSGDPRYFLGTDSAPHADDAKESACGCAGCFTATNTMSILAHMFEGQGALHRLEAFVAHHGADFYGMARNEATITLEKSADPVPFPTSLQTGAGKVTVFDPGFALHWRVRH